MKSLEATSQKIVELRAIFKACHAIVSVIKAPNVQATNSLSEIKLQERVPIVSAFDTPIVQVIDDALIEIKLEEPLSLGSNVMIIDDVLIGNIKLGEQVPVVSVLETPTVSNALIGDIKLKEQPTLVSVVNIPIVQVIDGALISETKPGEKITLVSAMKITGDALIRELKVEEKPTLVSTVQTTGNALISEVKLEEKFALVSVVKTSISQATSSAIDSQTHFEGTMRSLGISRQGMVEVRAGWKADVISVAKKHTTSAPIIETKMEKQVLEIPTPEVSGDVPICKIMLEEQAPVVDQPTVQIAGDALIKEIKLEKQAPVVEIPILQMTSTAIGSQTRFDRGMRSLESTRERVVKVRTAWEADFEKFLSIIFVAKKHIVSVPISEIKLEEQFPVVPVVKTPDVQVTSTLNSKIRLLGQSPVLAPLGTPPPQVTDAPNRETTLQERLSIILKNLPPLSQLPRFTVAEINATAVSFEQSIMNLVALRNKIAETRAGLEVTAGGRARVASIVRHSPPRSPVSLRHSIFTHSDSDESEYEDIDAKDCPATPELDYYDSEAESDQSDIEGTKPFPKFESKKARILREKREALAATLTDDMLFNLLLVDCTNKPRLPDKAPIIIRKRISKVPINWEPRYIGKYRVQWWRSTSRWSGVCSWGNSVVVAKAHVN